jgi:hypothetical protein
MCSFGGGGGSKTPDMYSNGRFDKFENIWNRWSEQELKAAEQGTDMSKLNDPTRRIETMVDKLGKDPRAQMEMRELERQHAIDLGKIGIDSNFDKFNKKYYEGYKDDYKGYYAPQVEDQFNESTGKLTAALADRGMLESSVGNAAQAKLFKDYGQTNTNIANEALDAANKLRSTVQQQKSSLYSLNEASADPMGVNAQAIGASTALVAPPTYSPLGQLFTAALQPFMNYQQSSANAPSRTYRSPYASPSGSGKVI